MGQLPGYIVKMADNKYLLHYANASGGWTWSPDHRYKLKSVVARGWNSGISSIDVKLTVQDATGNENYLYWNHVTQDVAAMTCELSHNYKLPDYIVDINHKIILLLTSVGGMVHFDLLIEDLEELPVSEPVIKKCDLINWILGRC